MIRLRLLLTRVLLGASGTRSSFAYAVDKSGSLRSGPDMEATPEDIASDPNILLME
jgi:hypothetical protein